jgi:hypothetical protein
MIGGPGGYRTGFPVEAESFESFGCLGGAATMKCVTTYSGRQIVETWQLYW